MSGNTKGKLMTNKPRLFSNSGFSMIEIMIAVMVIGVGVIPFSTCLAQGHGGFNLVFEK